MLWHELSALEANEFAFWSTRLGGFQDGAYGLTPKKPWSTDYYFEDEIPKQGIVLHGTVGTLQGDLPEFTQTGRHIGPSLVIARDGRSYQLFDPKYWSNHLGKNVETVGGNTFLSPRTIAIELSNVGPLWLGPDGDTLMAFEGSRAQPYCSRTNDPSAYQALDYRGVSYFATLTAKQYATLDTVLSKLCTAFGIPKTLLPAASRFEVFANAATARAYRGISSHVNYRAAGKTDIGPAFDWARIQAP